MRVGLRVRVRGPNLQHRGVGDTVTDDLVHLERARGRRRARLGVRGSVSVRVSVRASMRVRVRVRVRGRVGFTEVQHDLGKPW